MYAVPRLLAEPNRNANDGHKAIGYRTFGGLDLARYTSKSHPTSADFPQNFHTILTAILLSHGQETGKQAVYSVTVHEGRQWQTGLLF